MSINPIDNFFKFDYVCMSFFQLFHQKIKEYLEEYVISINTLPIKIKDISKNLQKLSFRTCYEEMDSLINNCPLEIYLSQIKQNCFNIIGEINIETELRKLNETVEGLKAFSEDIVSVKHFIYKDNVEYFGEASINNDIKHGIGCMIFKNDGLIYLGLFQDDAFINGIIIQNEKNIIYKGEFDTKTNTFNGLKMKHNTKQVDNFFFGQIDFTKGIYTGSSIKFGHNEKGIDMNTAAISYYDKNEITLFLQYFPDKKRKIFLMDYKNNNSFQYSTKHYLLQHFGDKNKKDISIFFKIKHVYYVGELLENKLIFDGNGLVLYNNGDIYNGFIKMGKKHGQGVYYNHETGKIYEGEYNNDGIIKGIYKDAFKEEPIYSGEFTDENKIKKGKLFYSNNDTYEGCFFENVREGEGTYTHKSIQGEDLLFKGDWTNDNLIGEASITGFENYRVVFDEKGNPTQIYSKGY